MNASRGMTVCLAAVAIIGTGAAGAQAHVGRDHQPRDLVCTGSVHGKTVRNLTVPSGNTCAFVGGEVRGSVNVAPGATLNLTRSRVGGGLTNSGQFTGGPAEIVVRSTTVRGDVKLSAAHATFVDSRLGSYVANGFSGDTTTMTRTRVAGELTTTGRSNVTSLDRVMVGGKVTTGSSASTRIAGSVLGADADLNGAINLCGSTVRGAATVNAAMGTNLGNGKDCRGNVFAGTLNVASISGPMSFHGNMVKDRTTSPDTQIPVTGGRNRFLGGVTGVLSTLR